MGKDMALSGAGGLRRRRRASLELFVAIALLLPSAAPAAGDFVASRARTFTEHLTAFARVEPEAVLPIRAQIAGVVDGLSALPGDPVQPGQVLGRLGGSQAEALLSQRRAALRSARVKLESARQALAIEKKKAKARLSTRLTVDRARAALAEAKAQLETARSRLQATLSLQAIRSPVAGTLLALHATDGERVARGEAILTVEPANRLWLHAVYYGSDAAAVHVGMSGNFAPADGGPSVPVRVRSVAAALRPDAGRAVGLLPVHPAPHWLSGAFGTVALAGPTRTIAAVPTRALILDGGRWFVLVHTDRGDRRQVVTPGPSKGDWTGIVAGLAPGTPVVVEDAYLEFHRQVSRQYRPPD